MALVGLLGAGARAVGGQMVKSTGKKIVASKVFNKKSERRKINENEKNSEETVERSSAITYQRNRINFKDFLVDVEETSPKTVKKGGSIGPQLKLIRTEVYSIEKILKKDLKKDEKYAEKKRRLLEKESRGDRETSRETPKFGPKGLALAKKLVPGGGIIDAIQKFIGNILLGKFLLFLIESFDKIAEFLKFIQPVTDFLTNTIGALFNGIVSVVEGAYNVNEAIRKEIEAVGGEGALKEYDKFTDAFKKFANIAIILALLGVPGSIGPKGGPKGPFSKPGSTVSKTGKGLGGTSAIRQYTARGGAAKLIEKKLGNPAAKIYENAIKNGKTPAQAKAAVDRAIKSGKIKPTVSGPGLGRGGTQARGLTGGIMRRGVGQAGSRLQTRILGRGARLGINRVGTRVASKIAKFGGGRIPILGPLVVGIMSLMNGEPAGQALFKAGGAALGGFLGTFIPIPILGTIVGGILGEYVGDLFYQLLTKGVIGGLGNKLKNTFKKVIDTGTLIKDWFLKGIGNVQKQDGGIIGNFEIGIPFTNIKFKLGGWAELLNPIANPLKKLSIVKDSFFSESSTVKIPYSDSATSSDSEDGKSKTDLTPDVPVGAEYGEGEMDLFKRLVIAEAGGEGKLGMALVARSVLNRTGLIQSGRATLGTFLAKDNTVTGVIMGNRQYQPITDGSVEGPFTDAQKRSALEAIQLAEDPEKLKQALIADGVSPADASMMIASTGFRTGSAFNDPSQNVNVTKYKNHYFNTAGNPTRKAQTAKIVFDESKIDSGAYATGLKTGPAGQIGSGTEYHVDTKILKSLDMKQKVAMVDQLARGYAERGRKIEFSNSAVSGEVYNPNASFEEKEKLLKRVFAAHSHSVSSNYNSLDYYIPKITESRFGKSAEGVEILSPTLGGSKIEYHQGGGYGAFTVLVDENGNVISKTGHGDIRGAKTGVVSIENKSKTNTEKTNTEKIKKEDLNEKLQKFIKTENRSGKGIAIPELGMRMIKGSDFFGITETKLFDINSGKLISSGDTLDVMEQVKYKLYERGYPKEASVVEKVIKSEKSRRGIKPQTPMVDGISPQATPPSSTITLQPEQSQKTSQLPNLNDVKSAAARIGKIGANEGTGERIRIPNVGTFVSGRDFLGRGEDKYFDPSGRNIGNEEFIKRLKELNVELNNTPIPPPLKPTLSPTPPKPLTNLETSASYEDANSDVLIAIQPIIITKPVEASLFG